MKTVNTTPCPSCSFSFSYLRLRSRRYIAWKRIQLVASISASWLRRFNNIDWTTNSLYRILTVNAFLAEQFPTAFTSRRNATGHVVDAVGVEKHLLDALSEMLNFRKVLTTREILKIKSTGARLAQVYNKFLFVEVLYIGFILAFAKKFIFYLILASRTFLFPYPCSMIPSLLEERPTT